MRRAKPVGGASDGRMDAAEAELERRFVAERQIPPRCDLEARENMPNVDVWDNYELRLGFGQTYVIGWRVLAERYVPTGGTTTFT